MVKRLNKIWTCRGHFFILHSPEDIWKKKKLLSRNLKIIAMRNKNNHTQYRNEKKNEKMAFRRGRQSWVQTKEVNS
jgi:hypothetical protein